MTFEEANLRGLTVVGTLVATVFLHNLVVLLDPPIIVLVRVPFSVHVPPEGALGCKT